MIFKQWRQVVGLQEPPKGQTRRPVNTTEWFVDRDDEPERVVEVTSYGKWRVKWQVGRTYAVQRPDRKTVGRFLLTKIRRERLGDISNFDMLKEGIKPWPQHINPTQPYNYERWREQFRQLWDSIYGEGAFNRMKDDDVWVLEWPPVEVPNG